MVIFWTTVCFLVYALKTDVGVLAASSSQPQKDTEGLANSSEDAVPLEKLQEMLWFFRREDPSAWNFCILGLSFLVLLIGVVLLGANIRANRNRKVLFLHKQGYEVSPPNEAEIKQAFVLLNQDDLNPTGEDLPPKAPNTGEVMIHWKDGKVSALYGDANEEEA